MWRLRAERFRDAGRDSIRPRRFDGEQIVDVGAPSATSGGEGVELGTRWPVREVVMHPTNAIGDARTLCTSPSTTNGAALAPARVRCWPRRRRAHDGYGTEVPPGAAAVGGSPLPRIRSSGRGQAASCSATSRPPALTPCSPEAGLAGRRAESRVCLRTLVRCRRRFGDLRRSVLRPRRRRACAGALSDGMEGGSEPAVASRVSVVVVSRTTSSAQGRVAPPGVATSICAAVTRPATVITNAGQD